MKLFWNIFVLLTFVNFMALPSIAIVLGFEIPQTNMVISEEENHASSASLLYEKAIPKTLDVHDFLKFFTTDSHKKAFFSIDDSRHTSPHLIIFSPPPEA